MKLPNRIGHNFTPVEQLDIEQIFTSDLRFHRRLKVFANKGCTCLLCLKKVGVYLISARGWRGSLHVDLYTEDFELMTIDHIIPKSKGGSNSMRNLIPACNSCNSAKSNKLIKPAKMKILSDHLYIQVLLVKPGESTYQAYQTLFAGNETDVYNFLKNEDIDNNISNIKITETSFDDSVLASDWKASFEDNCALIQWEQSNRCGSFYITDKILKDLAANNITGNG